MEQRRRSEAKKAGKKSKRSEKKRLRKIER